jgi:hypothetical protein
MPSSFVGVAGIIGFFSGCVNGLAMKKQIVVSCPSNQKIGIAGIAWN